MSALPPKADMCGAPEHVCFGPKADMAQAATVASNSGLKIGRAFISPLRPARGIASSREVAAL